MAEERREAAETNLQEAEAIHRHQLNLNIRLADINMAVERDRAGEQRDREGEVAGRGDGVVE